MQRVDEFLQAVEGRLRCPVDRRPAVIEELRDHLADRVAALVEQARDAEEAERQAVREMGPAWLLALRLSVANAWNVFAHVLRELWAAMIGFEVAVGIGLLIYNVTDFGRPSDHIEPAQWAYIVPTSVWLLAVLLAFGLAMGRVVRGCTWAVVPGGTLFAMALMSHPMQSERSAVAAAWLLTGAVGVFAASAVGQRRVSPRLAWLAWGSVVLVAASVLVYSIVVLMTSGAAPTGGVPLHSVVAALVESVREAARTSEITIAWQVLALSWAFWFAAWAIERFGQVRPAGAARIQ